MATAADDDKDNSEELKSSQQNMLMMEADDADPSEPIDISCNNIPDEWKDVQKRISQVDVETVDKLLSLPNRGEFINWKNPAQINPIPGSTVLHCAIAAQRLDIASLLLKNRDADPDVQAKYEETPLIVATKTGNPAAVELLLDHGANPDLGNRKENTPLIWAARKGFLSIVRLLLERGAYSNACNRDGETPLHGAAAQNHIRIVKLLLEHGAHPNLSAKSGGTPLSRASAKGYAVTVALLLEHGADPSIPNALGKTPLVMASDAGHSTTVELLLKHNANPNVGKSSERLPLVLASMQNHSKIVEFLLDHGADPNLYSEVDGTTPLICASIRGHVQTVDLLLENGADHKICNPEDGDSALNAAAKNGQIRVVHALLEKGANVNIQNSLGDTPLISASKNGKRTTVELLLNSGADPTVCDMYGYTPLLHACESAHDDTVQLFLERGGNIIWKWKRAPSVGESKRLLGFDDETEKTVLGFILDNNLKLSWIWAFENRETLNVNAKLPNGEKWWNVTVRNGRSNLHMACLENNELKAQRMLDIGTDKDKTDDHGHTPLFYASEKGFINLVALLCNHGANVNKTDERRSIAGRSGQARTISTGIFSTSQSSRYSVADGRTPIFIASQNGHQAVVALLLQHGADHYLCNNESQIPSEVSIVHWPIQQLFRIQDYLDRREQGVSFPEKYRTCRETTWDSPSHRNKMETSQLQEIIHDMVKYPQYTEHFLDLYKENKDIVNWLDEDGRTVRQVACKECREVTLFMDRYDLEDQPKYESPTCKIYNARDCGGAQDATNTPEPKHVVMKFIAKKEHFVNEIRARRKEDGSPRFSWEYVTPDIDAYRADENSNYADACKRWQFHGNDSTCLPPFCIVMEWGERSLLEAMNAENLSASHKDLQRREILLTLCKIFSSIHGKGYIHGDIKAHNVVRHTGLKINWKAIDFDVCTRIGEVAGLKLTTGSAPPEMLKTTSLEKSAAASASKANAVLRQPEFCFDESELLLADPSFDVWSYGMLMYQLMTGRSFFHCDLQGNLDQGGLNELGNLTQTSINEKLATVEDVNARILLSRILRLNPKERPTMEEIEKDYYFHPSESPQGRKTEFFGKQGSSIIVESDSRIPQSPLTATEHSIKGNDAGYKIEEFSAFAGSKSDFSYFKLRDEDKDWSDKLLNSEIEAFKFDRLEGMGAKPQLIDGDTIYWNSDLCDMLSRKGPDFLMGCLVEFFDLYKIMSHAHEICQTIKANLVSDVKSLKGLFVKLFVRGKGLNDALRGTLFCNSIEQFKYVGRQLKEQYGYHVYMKPPKREARAWPIPKLLIYGNKRIDGRCMSVEIQFSTVYMHLAVQTSNNHLVYEAMREASGYLGGKGEEFHTFLESLNKKHVDTEGFLKNGHDDEGHFEVQGTGIEAGSSGRAYSASNLDHKSKATGFILGGLVGCRDRKFRFLSPTSYMQQYSASSFVVNKNLTLLSSHSYWSEEAYDLEGKAVEFVVSFKGRGLAIVGVGTSQCQHGSEGIGERCSVHVGRSKFVVRKNGCEKVFRETRLPNQTKAKVIFMLKAERLLVSFLGSGAERVCETMEVYMPSNQRYHLYMRAPPGVHDMKFHDIRVAEGDPKDSFSWKHVAYSLVSLFLLIFGQSLWASAESRFMVFP